MPVGTASSDMVCASPAEVMGITLMPRPSIRNGYSFVPWAEPRYFTTRRRRVVTWSCTRLSSRITQSETYSSIPYRVSCPSPRSPVMMAVTPRSFSQPNRRRSSARKIALSVRLENRASIVSSTTRFAPTLSIAKPSRTNMPSRSYSPLSSISDRSRRT